MVIRRAKRRLRGFLARLARTSFGRAVLAAVLKDDEVLAWTVWHLSDRLCGEASFDDAAPIAVGRIDGFEDLHWLYSSNALNQCLSRLAFDEGAYLYRLVRGLDAPHVAELGRYKGGTTFLLAAAGATVTSLDVRAEQQDGFDPALRQALAHFDLAGRVELVVADSHTYPVPDAHFDVVLLDGDITYEGMKADVENWWPGLATGGHLILHLVDPHEVRWRVLADGFKPLWGLADEIAQRPGARRISSAPPSLAHVVKA
jgi:SAM-dependent methyltransferase